ncbi:MAG: hypothetical protein KBH06_07175 [Spirochaetes bacterium]|nr:hypothetical protein [Spirochaetota bacterium]
MKYLDKDEKDLNDALKVMDINVIPKPSKSFQKMMKKTAGDFIAKETKMNIRINSHELNAIKSIAESEGLKYQTFIKMVLHKYVTGQLIEKKKYK